MTEITLGAPQQPKIPVIGLYAPTRGRTSLCASTMNNWAQLSEDSANIRFMIGVDKDDETAANIKGANGLMVHTFDESVITCGGRNKALADALDVDIYLCINDYYFVLTQYWDNILRQAMFGGGNEILNLPYAPEIGSYNTTACTKKWMRLANKFEPQIFPFWFSDQWRVEMHCFVFNKPPMTYDAIKIGGTHGRTQNMHDADFWWGLFHALRPRRLREAYEVYKGYGLHAETFEKFCDARLDWIDNFIRVDIAKRPRLKGLQDTYGSLGKPSEKYTRAKTVADALIEREGLELWKMKWLRMDGSTE